jgi:hypothetical protein
MLPGPNQIIACPHCGALEYYETLMSGNTFGAKLYSDGKQIAPYMPAPPPFVECHVCHQLFWLKDAMEIGTVSPWNSSANDDPSWVAAPQVQSASEEKLYEAIERLVADGSSEQLKQVRILAWHKRNDLYREDASTPIELTAVARKNMQDLSIELSGGGRKGDEVALGDGLMIAELLREQGLFEPAIAFLDKNNWASLQTFADQLTELCRQKNSRVVELSG